MYLMYYRLYIKYMTSHSSSLLIHPMYHLIHLLLPLLLLLHVGKATPDITSDETIDMGDNRKYIISVPY